MWRSCTQVEAAAGVPCSQQQLFWGRRELTPEYDDKTLMDLNL